MLCSLLLTFLFGANKSEQRPRLVLYLCVSSVDACARTYSGPACARARSVKHRLHCRRPRLRPALRAARRQGDPCWTRKSGDLEEARPWRRRAARGAGRGPADPAACPAQEGHTGAVRRAWRGRGGADVGKATLPHIRDTAWSIRWRVGERLGHDMTAWAGAAPSSPAGGPSCCCRRCWRGPHDGASGLARPLACRSPPWPAPSPARTGRRDFTPTVKTRGVSDPVLMCSWRHARRMP